MSGAPGDWCALSRSCGASPPAATPTTRCWQAADLAARLFEVSTAPRIATAAVKLLRWLDARVPTSHRIQASQAAPRRQGPRALAAPAGSCRDRAPPVPTSPRPPRRSAAVIDSRRRAIERAVFGFNASSCPISARDAGLDEDVVFARAAHRTGAGVLRSEERAADAGADGRRDLRYDDDVVSKIRIGRQPDATSRRARPRGRRRASACSRCTAPSGS